MLSKLKKALDDEKDQGERMAAELATVKQTAISFAEQLESVTKERDALAQTLHACTDRLSVQDDHLDAHTQVSVRLHVMNLYIIFRTSTSTCLVPTHRIQ